MSEMQQNLFILLYITGIFPFILSLPRKYYLILETKTWHEARAYCQEKHTSLVTIRNDDDMRQLQELADSHGFGSHAWLGLYNDINRWQWSFQGMPLGNETFWRSGQPNNAAASILCGITDQGEWEDKPCEELHHFICFDDRYSGTDRYILITEKFSWHDSQRYCRTYHTDLTSMRDATETQVVTEKKPTGNTWIGLFTETWMWIDEINVSSIVWKSGQPDNNNAPEDCGLWNKGEMEDKPCSEAKSFFCYSEITGQKQIVRIKVSSKKNANDPAVKEAILEKINENLREVGLAVNTTVTWREQPDGKVFHKQEAKKVMEENNICEL